MKAPYYLIELRQYVPLGDPNEVYVFMKTMTVVVAQVELNINS